MFMKLDIARVFGRASFIWNGPCMPSCICFLVWLYEKSFADVQRGDKFVIADFDDDDDESVSVSYFDIVLLCDGDYLQCEIGCLCSVVFVLYGFV